MPKLSIIIPCYFNEKNIPITTATLLENEQLFPQNVEFEYVFVDDGSGDNTLNELLKFKEQKGENVIIVKLSTNFGAHNASLAGLNQATGDANVILAADLQDPPELIAKMYEYWEKGIKLVVANRTDRDESAFQKMFSNTFHYLMRRSAIKNAPEGGFDLTLFDKQLREELVKMNEKNTHIVYLLMWLGFDYVAIPYVRQKRKVGKSTWTLDKKLKSFVDSFVSFSYLPIRTISIVAFILSLGTLGYSIAVIIAKCLGYIEVQGWTALMVVILFTASFQMLAIAVIGEYLWRTHEASKNRPPYIVEKVFK